MRNGRDYAKTPLRKPRLGGGTVGKHADFSRLGIRFTMAWLCTKGERRRAKRTMSNVEWLLREATDTPLPVGEFTRIEDAHWRAVIERLDIGPGLRVILTTAQVRHPLTVEPRNDEIEPTMGGHVVVSGRMTLALPDGQKSCLAPDRAILLRSVERVARFRLAAPQRLRASAFVLRLDRLRRLFDGESPQVLRPLIEPQASKSRIVAMPATRRIRDLSAALFAPGLNGPLRRLFQEGVVLQLLAAQVAALARQPVARLRNGLSAPERAAVLEARERLLADMRAPPCLSDLAAAVGLTEKRLNAGFRTLFGATVFETLRNERLEHARIAFEAGEASLKEIAFRVGYNHTTNFISAFTARYGAPPRRYVDDAC
jgi:AraC-like DNA-binding protein